MAHIHGKEAMKGGMEMMNDMEMMKGMGMMKGMNHAAEAVGKHVTKGTVASAAVSSGGKLMSKAAKHPVLVFGAGLVAGVLIYKYRKKIISGANKAIDGGKDFVLQQKENLEDIVAESKEKE